MHLLSLDGPHEVVVVVDGIFLQRPELADLWDTTVWVEADLEVAAERERYRLRHVPAQRRYIRQHRPDERTTFVFRNTDVREPELVRQPRPR